jgi:hypothetical protein
MFPKREVNCRYYSTCLDICIDSNAKSFTCRNCTEHVDRDGITFEELRGCCALMGEIFFRKHVQRRQEVRCPRCGKLHTRMGGKGASPRRFCPACTRHISESYRNYDSGAHVEVRSACRTVTRLATITDTVDELYPESI